MFDPTCDITCGNDVSDLSVRKRDITTWAPYCRNVTWSRDGHLGGQIHFTAERQRPKRHRSTACQVLGGRCSSPMSLSPVVASEVPTVRASEVTLLLATSVGTGDWLSMHRLTKQIGVGFPRQSMEESARGASVARDARPSLNSEHKPTPNLRLRRERAHPHHLCSHISTHTKQVYTSPLFILNS